MVILLKKLLLSLLITIILCIYLYTQNNWIEVENFNIKINNLPISFNNFKIAHISDVHLRNNKKGYKNIINTISKENPDMIILTGDLIDRRSNIEKTNLSNFSKSLSEIAPTYAVNGNHEVDNDNLDLWSNILTKNGVKVINDKIDIFNKNDEGIALGGLSNGSKYNNDSFQNINSIKDMPLILLAHRPDLFDSYSDKTNEKLPSLIFSGHAHGGQVILPFINKGVIAPNQGFFPQYSNGLYEKNNVKLIVSRGIGNSLFPFRINNRPHIPIITLN